MDTGPRSVANRCNLHSKIFYQILASALVAPTRSLSWRVEVDLANPVCAERDRSSQQCPTNQCRIRRRRPVEVFHRAQSPSRLDLVGVTICKTSMPRGQLAVVVVVVSRLWEGLRSLVRICLACRCHHQELSHLKRSATHPPTFQTSRLRCSCRLRIVVYRQPGQYLLEDYSGSPGICHRHTIVNG